MRTWTATKAPQWVWGGVDAFGGKVTRAPRMVLSGVFSNLYL